MIMEAAATSSHRRPPLPLISYGPASREMIMEAAVATSYRPALQIEHETNCSLSAEGMTLVPPPWYVVAA
jgi:hypothetical protein